MKLFLNYGDQKFILSRKRISLEAQNLNYFDKIITETEDVKNDLEIIDCLKNPNFKKVFTAKRGGGYWLWKPYLIKHLMESMDENEVVLLRQ